MAKLNTETNKRSALNYIQQINAFWDRLEQSQDLKHSSAIVYLALLQINNHTGWKKRFQVTFGEVLSMTGIANIKTYYSAIIELAERGYILYEKGPNQYKAATFELPLLYQKLEEQLVEQLGKHGLSTDQSTGKARVKHGLSTGNIPKLLNLETNKQLNSENSEAKISYYSRDENFENSILKYFGFNQIANPDKQILIGQFCHSLHNSNQLENFKKQFASYQIWISIIGANYRFGFAKFIGNQSQLFLDGAWNSENWEQKINDRKSFQTPEQTHQAPAKESAIERRNRLLNGKGVTQ